MTQSKNNRGFNSKNDRNRTKKFGHHTVREKYKIDPTEEFVNPYNFTPHHQNKVSNSRKDPADSEIMGNHTGYFQCRLITKTPLAIPDISKRELSGNEHYKYPFMSVDGQKIIPGSSIRGMLRSVYEAVTDSCMCTLRDENISVRNDPKNAFRPGLLMKEDGTWKLYAAKNAYLYEKPVKIGENAATLENGVPIYWGQPVKATKPSSGTGKSKVHIAPKESKDASFGEDGYIFIGESFGKKNAVCECFFKQECKLEDASEQKKALDYIIEVYQDPAINRNIKDEAGASWYKGYDKIKEGPVIPIWYDEKNPQYVSPAAIGRKTFLKTMYDLIGEPCKDRKNLCPACSLFGMAGENAGMGYGSRIRITDAICVKDSGTNDSTLKELGKPRTSYLPFYSFDGKDYDVSGASIRGRKFYWHNPMAESDSSVYEAKNGTATKRNSTMELMQPGAEFVFQIYFDNINDLQMKELRWLVSLGENQRNSDFCFKIGHGKPLGLGSIKILIEEQIERKIDPTGQYCLEKEDGVENQQYMPSDRIKQSSGYKDAMQILNYHALKNVKICYPYIEEPPIKLNKMKENDVANHQWFSENKKQKNVMPLPSIGETVEKKKYLKAFAINTRKEMMGEDILEARISSCNDKGITVVIGKISGTLLVPEEKKKSLAKKDCVKVVLDHQEGPKRYYRFIEKV